MSEILRKNMPNCLPDVQSLEDERHIDIDRVGIKGLTCLLYTSDAADE